MTLTLSLKIIGLDSRYFIVLLIGAKPLLKGILIFFSRFSDFSCELLFIIYFLLMIGRNRTSIPKIFRLKYRQASHEEITLSKLRDKLMDLKAIIDIRLEIRAQLAITVTEPVASLIEIIDEEHDFSHATTL